MKLQFVLFMTLSVIWLPCLTLSDPIYERSKRSPDKYDDHYDKFITKHFSDLSKYTEEKEEDKNESNESDSYEDEEAKVPKKTDENYGRYSYNNNNDYQRIKSLSEAQVAKLHEKPGNCKHFEKDGMICAACKDPETGDTSESCSFSSEPHDKKVAYTSKKSHNYKSPVEVEEPINYENENDDQEEAPVTPSAKVTNPAKQYKSEFEDAGDYSAFKLANYNSDLDYDEPKFGHLKLKKPKKSEELKSDFEILPKSQFKTRNLNEALTDFQTKDWSKCRKTLKGDMTCYNCKDAKGATQEECMFISSSSPKNLKAENFKKPNTNLSNAVEFVKLPPQTAANNHERFARIRMGRPLMPTKAALTKAEPLVTPKIKTKINPVDHFQSDSSLKKTIKRTALLKKRVINESSPPSKSRVAAFETHVHHKD